MTILQFVVLGSALFCLGIYGVLTRRNAVMVLLSVELMLAAVNINLVAFNAYFIGEGATSELFAGQIFTLFLIAVAAAEVGIGLAIVLLIFRNRKSANVDELDLLKL